MHLAIHPFSDNSAIFFILYLYNIITAIVVIRKIR